MRMQAAHFFFFLPLLRIMTLRECWQMLNDSRGHTISDATVDNLLADMLRRVHKQLQTPTEDVLACLPAPSGLQVDPLITLQYVWGQLMNQPSDPKRPATQVRATQVYESAQMHHAPCRGYQCGC